MTISTCKFILNKLICCSCIDNLFTAPTTVRLRSFCVCSRLMSYWHSVQCVNMLCKTRLLYWMNNGTVQKRRSSHVSCLRYEFLSLFRARHWLYLRDSFATSTVRSWLWMIDGSFVVVRTSMTVPWMETMILRLRWWLVRQIRQVIDWKAHMITEDSDMVESMMDGKKYMASAYATTLRRTLMRGKSFTLTFSGPY